MHAAELQVTGSSGRMVSMMCWDLSSKEEIDNRVRFPCCALRSEVEAVDSLDHADESVESGGPATMVTPRERVRPTVVRLWPSSSRPRNLEEPKRTMAVCAVSPATCDRVSARRSKRRAWTCLAVTCVSEGAPVQAGWPGQRGARLPACQCPQKAWQSWFVHPGAV